MVAVSLASGNEKFRDKLREKLEASGGVACRVTSQKQTIVYSVSNHSIYTYFLSKEHEADFRDEEDSHQAKNQKV